MFINFFLDLICRELQGIALGKASLPRATGPALGADFFFLPGLDQWFAGSRRRGLPRAALEKDLIFLEISFFVQFAESYSREIIIFIFLIFFVQLAS